MIDPATNEPIRVSALNEELTDITVSVQHLERVKDLLDANGVRYWVAHQQISFNHGPFMATVNLRPGTDYRKVQALLDAAA